MLTNKELPDNHHLSPKAKKKLEDVFDNIKAENTHFIGYPCTNKFDYSVLLPFLQFPINNVGDPFSDNLYTMNTHEIEIEVIEWFSKLFNAEKNNTWGYVTSGGTEGNMYGIYIAKEIYPNGIVYYSEDTHYSVAKILRMFGLKSIKIKSSQNGEIDYKDLTNVLASRRDAPAILFANIGTTMKGAIDDISRIQKILSDLAIDDFYIHCDAALSGMTLPFMETAPEFDFQSGIHSIAVSGHKFIGSPIPSGIVLAKKDNVDRVSKKINYIGSVDNTISGSRNGITPLFLWYAIQIHGVDGFKEQVNYCLEMADYTINELKSIGINAWRNKCSFIVVFPTVNLEVLTEWQMAIDESTSHIITSTHITKEIIDEFIIDINSKIQA